MFWGGRLTSGLGSCSVQHWWGFLYALRQEMACLLSEEGVVESLAHDSKTVGHDVFRYTVKASEHREKSSFIIYGGFICTPAHWRVFAVSLDHMPCWVFNFIL